MGICVLSLAHESEMRGYLVYVLIVKYLPHRFCLNSATVYQTGRPYRGICGGFFRTFLEGSVDRVIYRDYIVNRHFFIYCSLATELQLLCRLRSKICSSRPSRRSQCADGRKLVSLVSWCFEPSQPQRITSGLKTIKFFS